MARDRVLRCFPLVLLLGLVTLLAPGRAAAQGGEQVDRYLERTGEIVAWAAERVQESDSQQARRVLDEAWRLHERAHAQADQGRGGVALRTSRRARDAAQHAVRLAREARGHDERAQQRLERFGELRDQIGERAREAADERALRFVREAESQAARARDHYHRGNFDLAVNLLEAAEDLLARAARLVFEGGGGERLAREVERTGQVIARVEERLGDRGETDGAAADLLRNARAALRRAEDLAGGGRTMRALQSLRLARRLAAQAASATRGDLDATAVQMQIDRWDGRHEQVAARVQESDLALATETLARARDHRDRAAALLAADDLEPALRQIKAALDLLNKANELAR
jgi:hypothetical protein